MGLFDFIHNELLELIEWVDASTDTVIWKFPDRDNNLKNGAQLTVRESQVAILLDQGRVADVFGPGRHELSTPNLPVLTTLRGWKYGFDSPFKVDVYFVSTRQFTNLKWGTPNPVILRDPEFKQVRVRAFGTFALRVREAAKFLTEFAGTNPVVRIGDVEGQLRSAIVNKFSDTLAEANVSVLDLARNYQELGERLRPLLQDDFGAYGLELTRFYLENASLPPEVEAFLDKTTQLGMAGDMARFQQFQAGLAVEKAAEQPSGVGGAAVLLGGLGSMLNATAAPTPPAPGPDRAQTMQLLRELGQLKAEGVLTEEEFNAKKTELLARL
ncbi:virion core protein (lumpy skin disease virus) [Hymenobacter sp. RP-2-7]|uniref:Virion core protein (Lumpy skin disease virus) n=1 Tax=Hymenobacter polaris TaxID=2682546 RepID=A0A7Y0AAZ7_9BACT|nr:SPFH domain-containing protein [Hymenobacter polaris]NML63997.1 virion core protein (lumpy skin disease virus) [Hymenobacter polaris]